MTVYIVNVDNFIPCINELAVVNLQEIILHNVLEIPPTIGCLIFRFRARGNIKCGIVVDRSRKRYGNSKRLFYLRDDGGEARTKPKSILIDG